jgi:hypothetical protein
LPITKNEWEIHLNDIKMQWKVAKELLKKFSIKIETLNLFAKLSLNGHWEKIMIILWISCKCTINQYRPMRLIAMHVFTNWKCASFFHYLYNSQSYLSVYFVLLNQCKTRSIFHENVCCFVVFFFYFEFWIALCSGSQQQHSKIFVNAQFLFWYISYFSCV